MHKLIMQCKANFYWKFKYEMQLLKYDKYARDRKLSFWMVSRLFFLEWGCFLLFHLEGLVRIRGWWCWGRIFLFTPSPFLLLLLLLDKLLRFFNRLWFLHLDPLHRMLLLFLFLIKEGLSKGKSKYFFSSSKVELDLPRSHIYVSICSMKEKDDQGLKVYPCRCPCLKS